MFPSLLLKWNTQLCKEAGCFFESDKSTGADMNKVKQRLKVFLGIFLLITAAGTFAFMHLENLSFSKALYYNIVTMSTVGYGDIYPSSPLSRLFAVFLIVAGGAAFLGVIANATELIILKRDAQNRMRKINMVLGVFFSEVGDKLLGLFSQNDKAIDGARDRLFITPKWTADQFSGARKAIMKLKLKVDIRSMDLDQLNAFLKSKRDFLVGLLENPVLVEHEDFSEALLAVFHLQDELGSRKSFDELPDTDRLHIAGDMTRAYRELVDQWLVYLEHLKIQYPYIFSLAVRKNPFDPDANPVVLEE